MALEEIMGLFSIWMFTDQQKQQKMFTNQEIYSVNHKKARKRIINYSEHLLADTAGKEIPQAVYN